jgi:starch-binding outer membrane protein, SusD/RagB family
MRKINSLYFIILLAGILVIGGCKKSYLEKIPFGSQLPGQALSTENGLIGAVNGAYATLRSVSLYGRDFVIIGDLMADNTYVEKRNSGRYLVQYNYTMTSSDGIAAEMWTAAYAGIMQANRVIDTASTVTGTKIPSIKAEAYAIRALLYFKLVNIYAKPYSDDPNALGVPLVLHYDPYFLPTRAKVSDIYQQIVSDLKAAFQDAPDYVNSTRFSKYSIEALLAKVYLYMGDKANAKAAAEDIIGVSGFTLVPASDYNKYWADPGFRADQVETMFEIDADAINNNGFDDYAGMYFNGYNDIYASQQLYNLYSATDVRKTVMEAGTAKIGSAAFVVTKFPNAAGSDRDNIKVIRLSEVYLIAAEAFLPADETKAKIYLNALVSQRDPSFAGYTSTGAALMNDITNERRKELAFEGDRFYDLQRLKLQVTRVANPAAIPAPLTIAYPFDKRLAPIPLGEIQANPNIAGQQNPGY